MDIAPERWRELSALLDQALDLTPEKRRAFLMDLGRRDPATRTLLEDLLSASDVAGGVLDRPAGNVITDDPGRPTADDSTGDPEPGGGLVGARVGPWRVLQEIGRGGMGVVYAAERADGQFEQRVALKVLKRGLDTDEILARFLRERQILARLQHPRIARLIDGGATEDGRPFFALEYVEGRPITEDCDRRRGAPAPVP